MSTATDTSGFSHLRRKTTASLLRAWRGIRGSALHVLGGDVHSGSVREDEIFLRRQMELCLDSPGGEISQRAHTANLGRTYLELDEEGRIRFLKLLASGFDVQHDAVADIARAYADSTTPEERQQLEIKLRQQLITPRSTILRQFTALPDGFKFLINMRADLLPIARENPSLKGLEYDLKHILSSWFDIGLLDLVEITWNSPAALLEKLIEYEAVHRVASWDDLKNRLDEDRRVFAFLHNKMPMEPLIFVHVALVKDMSDNIQHLLDEKAPRMDVEEADTAIFYSISNAQKGLTGISFGNFLIKRVVSLLAEEMKQLETYATLSPVPGFRAWLDPLLVEGADILLPEEKESLKKIAPDMAGGKKLHAVLESNWHENNQISITLKPVLMRLAAHYLVREKRGNRPLDPVASFHLFNGARLERLNWLGDCSTKGMQQSAGIMANYHYKLNEIDENHEVFVEYEKIVVGKQVKSYLE